ncbi:hypothetical protein T265_00735 [Opisthorchis viverrini]|uniref:Uncharacterized protein n=1 Tax=Opisthorchis viverrini TaxID=6198 RepID=A0A075A122_OPIVI|nr:hypothetical protein T265_00735 [Opisthorchis viverrini]KER33428.1 hypothetical protein T265_00735 [Opisthorchis viverrini]
MESVNDDSLERKQNNLPSTQNASSRSFKRGTSLLHQRHLNILRRPSARNSKEDKTMVVQSVASSDDVHLNVNENTGPTVESKSRLLTRRKQYSENRVPTISLDDPGVSTSSPNIASSLLSPPSIQQSQHRYISSTTLGLHPGCCTISPLAIPRLDVSMSQRALSASPSKDSSAGKLISYERNVFSACSMDSVGLKNNDSFRSNQLSDYTNPPHLSTPSSTQSPPGTSPSQLRSTLPSRLMATSPGSPPNSGISAISLVQQRSTESHESSISMPSATSSGSSGIPHSRARISRLAFHDRLINRSHENTPNTGSSRSPHSEPQTVHRRSSYEMATGKLDIPQPKVKRSALKSAFIALKDKRDAFFKRSSKTMDESNEISDPVYHLLRCAATPDHQPSTCKCVCHMDDFEGHRGLAEMSSPINVLFSPRSRPQPQLPYKTKLAESKSPHSLPTLYPDEGLTPSTEDYPTSRSGLSKKPTFSLPSILSRRKQKSQRKKEEGAVSSESGAVANALSGDHSRQHIFTFDSP